MFKFCEECEVHHADGACDTVRELRGIHDQITVDDVRLSAPCGWDADVGCVLGATHRVITVDGTGMKRDDDRLCDGHTLEWSTLVNRGGLFAGWRAVSWRLDDPTVPKLVDGSWGDPDNATLPEDREDLEAHDAQNALAATGAYEEETT